MNASLETRISRRELLTLTSAMAVSAVAAGRFVGAAHTAPNLPVYLQGQYKPTFTEETKTGLTVRGAIPPARDIVPPFWFAGSGMIHGSWIADAELKA